MNVLVSSFDRYYHVENCKVLHDNNESHYYIIESEDYAVRIDRKPAKCFLYWLAKETKKTEKLQQKYKFLEDN